MGHCASSERSTNEEGVSTESAEMASKVAGVSASFCDTVIYFTDVQMVENLELKNKMLPQRSHFSEQLKEYIENKYGTPNQTSFVYFSGKKEKLAKKMKKMQEKYRKDGKMIIRKVEGDFTFSLSNEED